MNGNKIKEVLFWILIAISVFMLLWKIFGNSPDYEAIILPLLVALLVDHSILKTKFSNFERQFGALVKDFKEHLVIFHGFEKQFSNLSNDFKTLNKNFREHLRNH